MHETFPAVPLQWHNKGFGSGAGQKAQFGVSEAGRKSVIFGVWLQVLAFAAQRVARPHSLRFPCKRAPVLGRASPAVKPPARCCDNDGESSGRSLWVSQAGRNRGRSDRPLSLKRGPIWARHGGKRPP